jgi:hypothetical protein
MTSAAAAANERQAKAVVAVVKQGAVHQVQGHLLLLQWQNFMNSRYV